MLPIKPIKHAIHGRACNSDNQRPPSRIINPIHNHKSTKSARAEVALSAAEPAPHEPQPTVPTTDRSAA
ncbi:hypothetical protein HHJ78_03525 [Mobiluncus mulieris]|uniref:Uncharacterized protein n=1 Tax=Mobiluncus mulieris TaxID=2052 RepID=A0A7Y0Y3P1_9ACTO|nr:hypothetical protein [Mobiluncus mulieris]NMW64621.1 hypothetical protein [Mobiluncus mulieris]